MSALQLFSQAVKGLNIASSSPVAVAVSGGCDSMALTYLAKQVFDRVVGITVDHRLREGSSEEASKTSQLVTSLRAEHHTRTLDWGALGPPPPGKVQIMAREKRYTALLNVCKELHINTLMLAHHQDDQNETFLFRFAMGSGIDGLGGMSPLTFWPCFPQIKIARPLLSLHKRDLVHVCTRERIEWVEDPTNLSVNYVRNHYRQVLWDHPHLVDGVEQLVRSCDQARSIANRQLRDLVTSLPKINKKNGYLSVQRDKLCSLPPPIAKRVLDCLLRYISASDHFLSYKDLNNAYQTIMATSGKSVSAGKGVIMSLGSGTLGIAKATHSNKRTLTPIQLGETLLWDGRWEITLKKQVRGDSRVKIQRGRKSTSTTPGNPDSAGSEVEDNLYFIRHMIKRDWEYAVRGVRVIRNASLPNVDVRGSLPVIVDREGRILLIPHFQFCEQLVNATAELEFKPRHSLKDIVDIRTLV